jgi:hypothetical protein
MLRNKKRARIAWRINTALWAVWLLGFPILWQTGLTKHATMPIGSFILQLIMSSALVAFIHIYGRVVISQEAVERAEKSLKKDHVDVQGIRESARNVAHPSWN